VVDLSTQKAPGIVKRVRNVESIFKTIGLGMLFILMLIGTADVIGRYLFNSPILGEVELSKILTVGIVILGWAYVQANKAHIRLTFVVSRFPPRAQAITDFVTSILSLVLFSLIAWQAVMVGLQCLEEHRVITIIHIPVAAMHFMVSAGASLICLEFIIQLINLCPLMIKAR
jgi:TRAP-type C4-dicarboxylate transport system permease small subunit